MFIALCAATLSACANTPPGGATALTKEKSKMSTSNHDALSEKPRMNAETALSKVLDLIRSGAGIKDFTPERISEITGLQMNFDGPDRFGAGEKVTPYWNYSFYMNRASLNGAQFVFSFDPVSLGQSPPATDICRMDFDEFSSALEGMGFKKQVNYGEHGQVVNYKFDSPHMFVSVGTEGEDNEPHEKIAHQCVRTATIN
jgi:hypothetical protein